MKRRVLVRLSRAAVPVLVLAAGPAGAHAQERDVEGLRERYRIPAPPTVAAGEVLVERIRAAPGISFGSPTGYGADGGDAFVGIGFQSRTRLLDEPDGGVAAGLGIGDANRLLGLEVTVTSFGTVRSCCRGGVSAKLHRRLPGLTSAAVGIENALTWGELEVGPGIATDAGTSLYAAVTRIFPIGRAESFLRTLSVTLGAGNGRFRTESDILEGRETINPFGSVALRVVEPASLIADWTGQDLNAGVSLVPFRDVPLVITPGFADLTTSPRFILGAGIGISYSPIF